MIFSKLAAPVVGGAIALAGANVIESALPVTMMMRAEPVSHSGNSYTVDVTGYKIKACTVVQDTFTGWYKAGGTWHETRITFPDDLTPDSSKPNSYDPVSFGMFRWSDLPLAATHVKMTVIHDCEGALSITTVGPWKIEEVRI